MILYDSEQSLTDHVTLYQILEPSVRIETVDKEWRESREKKQSKEGGRTEREIAESRERREIESKEGESVPPFIQK